MLDLEIKYISNGMFESNVYVVVNENKEAGYYETRFDGSAHASGIYIYRLTAENYISTKKMLMIK